MIDLLKNNRLLLASKSPRRRELLEKARIPFHLIDSHNEETFPPEIPVDKVARYISFQKAHDLRSELSSKDIILTADTVVIDGNRLLGKPRSNAHAIEMLTQLSGKSHTVTTGITLMSLAKTINSSCTTRVEFDKLTLAEIEHYVNTDLPLDKAGAYGIQDWIGVVKIRNISGSYENVMGLPVFMIYKILNSW